MIKHVFSGNLNASIDSNPPFPGQERHLLKAQLVRIAHASVAMPKDLMMLDDETNKAAYNPDFAMPSVEELKSLENWCNMWPIILKNGRCSHIAPEGMDEDAAAEYMDKQAEEDKTEDRFRILQEHTPMPGMGENPPF